MGKARYLQHSLGDDERTRVLGILVHGDAAFIGQVTLQESAVAEDES